jgi:hypothetical protein
MVVASNRPSRGHDLVATPVADGRGAAQIRIDAGQTGPTGSVPGGGDGAWRG